MLLSGRRTFELAHTANVFVLARQSLWIFSLINYEPPTYHNGKYEYPTWAHGLGWSITAVSLVCIPSYAIVTIVRAEGDTWFEVYMTPIFARID